MFLSTIGGTTTPLENLAVLVELLGGATRNPPLAAAGLAVGTYLGLHPLLLAVRFQSLPGLRGESWFPRAQGLGLGSVPRAQCFAVFCPGAARRAVRGYHVELTSCCTSLGCCMPSGFRIAGFRWGHHFPVMPPVHAFVPSPCLLQVPLATMMGWGTEDVTQTDLTSSHAVGNSSNEDSVGGSGKEATNPISKSGVKAAQSAAAAAGGGKQQQQQQQRPFDWRRCAAFALFTMAWTAALLWLSDAFLRTHSEAQCLPRLLQFLPGTARAPPAALSSCWLRSVHGFALAVEDYTPNIGLFWYFLTELFDAFRPFFKFVLHSHTLILAVPLSLRFPRRPLFVSWALLVSCAALRPYPSAGDLALWVALLPLLLAPQLRQLRFALFLSNSLVLLAVLGPAMWSQWIIVDAANPNFFYSITLLLGALHVIVLVMGVLLTVRVERLEAGKPVAQLGANDF